MKNSKAESKRSQKDKIAVGDLVAITFLDHGEEDGVDLNTDTKHPPVKSVVRGPVHRIGRCEGHPYIEIAMWQAKGENSRVAILLTSTILSIRKLK